MELGMKGNTVGDGYWDGDTDRCGHEIRDASVPETTYTTYYAITSSDRID